MRDRYRTVEGATRTSEDITILFCDVTGSTALGGDPRDRRLYDSPPLACFPTVVFRACLPRQTVVQDSPGCSRKRYTNQNPRSFAAGRNPVPSAMAAATSQARHVSQLKRYEIAPRRSSSPEPVRGYRGANQ
jgi:hypothetical protein